MSVSESAYWVLEESDFDMSYEELVERRVRENGPISAEELKSEMRNELRYDSFTDPDQVRLEDPRDIDEIFDDLRERNRGGRLSWDLGVIHNSGEDYFRKVDVPGFTGTYVQNSKPTG